MTSEISVIDQVEKLYPLFTEEENRPVAERAFCITASHTEAMSSTYAASLYQTGGMQIHWLYGLLQDQEPLSKEELQRALDISRKAIEVLTKESRRYETTLPSPLAVIKVLRDLMKTQGFLKERCRNCEKLRQHPDLLAAEPALDLPAA